MSIYLEFDANTIPAGGTAIGTVRLASAQAVDVVVLLSASDPALKIQRIVIIEAGTTSSEFTVEAGTLLYTVDYYVEAQVGSLILNYRLNLREPGLASISFSPNRVNSGEQVTLTVSLDSDAPSVGTLVLLDEVLGFDGEYTPLLIDLPKSAVVESGESSYTCTVTTRNWDGGRLPPPREVKTAVDGVLAGASDRAILTIVDP